jgi:hypothetical protein
VKNKKNRFYLEKGIIEIELLSVLIVLGLVISTSYSFVSISRMHNIHKEHRESILKISTCNASHDDNCKPVKRKNFTTLYSCQKQIMNFKPYCFYLKETQR